MSSYLQLTFNPSEEALVYQLASRLTGTCQDGRYRRKSILNSVLRRMEDLQCANLSDYLEVLKSDAFEVSQFISALTIHTTSWFREKPHFEKVSSEIKQLITASGGKTVNYKIWSAAASTGEEAYSLALLCEGIRAQHPNFEYIISGTDLDPVSVAKASACVFPIEALNSIPSDFHRHVVIGTDTAHGFFTLKKRIRSRCTFGVQNLSNDKSYRKNSFDLIFCRNVLIYFEHKEVLRIVSCLRSSLKNSGILVLGHSESVPSAEVNLLSIGASTYRLEERRRNRSGVQNLRVLSVNDSTMLKILHQRLSLAGLQTCGASTEVEADLAIVKFEPDIITLGLNRVWAREIDWIRKIRRRGVKVPIVVLIGTSVADAGLAFDAINAGAQDFVENISLTDSKSEFPRRLMQIARSESATIDQSLYLPKNLNEIAPPRVPKPDLILLGASTGGTEVLNRVLRHLPPNSPPILVVQHLSLPFLKSYAERLAESTGLKLANPVDQTPLLHGHLYMSFSDYHIGVDMVGGKIVLNLSVESPVHEQRPAIDILFSSASQLKGVNVLACLMTGMGSDGANGLLQLRNANATTLIQDRESCVVFGMPKVAMEMGAAQYQGNIESLHDLIQRVVSAGQSAA